MSDEAINSSRLIELDPAVDELLDTNKLVASNFFTSGTRMHPTVIIAPISLSSVHDRDSLLRVFPVTKIKSIHVPAIFQN